MLIAAPGNPASTTLPHMNPATFAIFCFVAFTVPAALIVWFDRPRGGR